MKITPLRTPIITAGAMSTAELVDAAVPSLAENSVIAITSKVVSLCERRVVPVQGTTKQALVEAVCDSYLADATPYGFHFTITMGTLIPAAGIDASNGGGYYVLWPKDPQTSVNALRRHLQDQHGLRRIGVIMTDSTSMPLRRGTVGICLAHSGFAAVNDYVGQRDLFGREYRVSRANVAGGLAAAAVVAMGEGAECTPLCVFEEIPNLRFEDHEPTEEEIAEARIRPEEDVFGPFLTSLSWKKGGGGNGPLPGAAGGESPTR